MTACWTVVSKWHIPFCRNPMCFETGRYSEPCQISKIKLFEKIFNGFEKGFEYAPVLKYV